MARSIPTVVVQAMNAQTTGQVFLTLLEISHSTIATLRLVNNTENVTYGGNTYTSFPFSVTLPPDNEEAQYQARISIDNASRYFVQSARELSASRERAKIKLIVVSDVSAGVANETLLTINDLEIITISYTAESLDITCRIESLLSESFPGYSFTPSNFPGIY